MNDNLASGFSTATIIPAIASTFKQAQREAAADLHVLADYHRRSSGRPTRHGPLPLSTAEGRAAEHLGIVLVEQGVNGTAFFVAVLMGVLTAGPIGGMLAQLAITGNTAITPHQTQKFNPAQLLFDRIGRRPDWISAVPEQIVISFALASGRLAAACGYGSTAPRRGGGSIRLRFA